MGRKAKRRKGGRVKGWGESRREGGGEQVYSNGPIDGSLMNCPAKQRARDTFGHLYTHLWPEREGGRGEEEE